MSAPEFSCSCDGCNKACSLKPGLFMPGEVEALAVRMGLSVEELFRTRLAVERVPCQPFDVLVLSPGILGVRMGAELPRGWLGSCVFFAGGKCAVHFLGKPHECATATHEGDADLAMVVNAWLPYQDRIRELLAAAAGGGY